MRAQAALSLMNLYRKAYNSEYLEYARKHIDWLLNNYCTGYSGHCWGAGFKIVISSKIFYDSNTPFSTITPYALEALYEYYLITQDSDILLIIGGIFKFYEEDIATIEENESILITSYGPSRDRIVTNAISYTMFAYSIFYKVLEDKDYIELKIKKMLNFISSVQKKDGSWSYAPFDDKSFIDCFHTAFVIKNIIKTSKNLNFKFESKAVDRGYSYIKNNFFNNEHQLFKRFSISNKFSLTSFDLYDNAEMLLLAKLMDDNEMIGIIDSAIKKSFITKKGVYSVLDITGVKRNKNTLRWAVMPYILAKTL